MDMREDFDSADGYYLTGTIPSSRHLGNARKPRKRPPVVAPSRPEAAAPADNTSVRTTRLPEAPLRPMVSRFQGRSEPMLPERKKLSDEKKLMALAPKK